MHAHPRVYVCIINKKTKGKFFGEHQVVWIGKTNIQGKKVYFSWGEIENNAYANFGRTTKSIMVFL